MDEDERISVAVEQYLFWRSEGYTIYEMIHAVNGSVNNYGMPEELNGDEMIYWLAGIWDGIGICAELAVTP